MILYADETTGSMKRALDETNRRRKIQLEYNKKHGITPQTIKKEIKSIVADEQKPKLPEEFTHLTDVADIPKLIREKEREMREYAKVLKFEDAALVRDEIVQLKKLKIR